MAKIAFDNISKSFPIFLYQIIVDTNLTPIDNPIQGLHRLKHA